jgi:hypothetical protein
LDSIEISEEFHNWAIKTLKEEKEKEQVDRDHLIKGHEENLSLVNRKLDTLFSMRFNNEIEPEEFTQRKNDLLKEKAHFMDLLNDAQHRADTWLERASNFFSFAETAKGRFENGTVTEKKEIIQALGSNLLLKDKNLFIKLSRPFEILKALAPEVRVLNGIFEPLSNEQKKDLHFFSGAFSSGGDSSGSYRPEVKNEHEEKWLASLRVLRTERASEIRCFQEIFRGSDVGELMLKVA